MLNGVFKYRMKNSPDTRHYRADSIVSIEYEGGDYIIIRTADGEVHEQGLYVVLSTNVADGWCLDHIKVDGHVGTWYTIDVIAVDQQVYFLLEHEEYGDETANLIVDLEGNLVLEDVWNGFEDLEDHLEIELNI